MPMRRSKSIAWLRKKRSERTLGSTFVCRPEISERFKRALKEGIPYQTLVSSVLDKFVDGQLVEKAADK
jgi:hypothetical protein